MRFSGGSWWPSELGSPNSSGAQNDMRYAYFSGPRRLVVEQNGVVTVYDTQDHQIGSVSQQQGGGQTLAFTSQLGTVDLQKLPLVSSNAPRAAAEESNPAQQSLRAMNETGAPAPPSGASSSSSSSSSSGATQADDIFAMIEKLAALKDKGILTDEEFAKKKAELLARL